MAQHLIAGKSTLLLAGLKHIILAEAGNLVTQVSMSIDEILPLVSSASFDFFWTEDQGEGGDFTPLYRNLQRLFPRIKIAVFNSNQNPRAVQNLINAGVRAYLLPNCMITRIKEAIWTMTNDEKYVDPQLGFYLTRRFHDDERITRRFSCELTRREHEVLQLIVEERTTSEIADMLHINFSTVETHRLHLIQKMRVRNTAGLVREALLQGFYDPLKIRSGIPIQ